MQRASAARAIVPAQVPRFALSGAIAGRAMLVTEPVGLGLRGCGGRLADR